MMERSTDSAKERRYRQKKKRNQWLVASTWITTLAAFTGFFAIWNHLGNGGGTTAAVRPAGQGSSGNNFSSDNGRHHRDGYRSNDGGGFGSGGSYGDGGSFGGSGSGSFGGSGSAQVNPGSSSGGFTTRAS